MTQDYEDYGDHPNGLTRGEEAREIQPYVFGLKDIFTCAFRWFRDRIAKACSYVAHSLLLREWNKLLYNFYLRIPLVPGMVYKRIDWWKICADRFSLL